MVEAGNRRKTESFWLKIGGEQDKNWKQKLFKLNMKRKEKMFKEVIVWTAKR